MARAFFGLVLAAALIGGSAQAQTVHPTLIAYRVVGDDGGLVEKFRKAVERLVKAQPGYQIRERAPQKELVVYVVKDTNDVGNPDAVAIAVAHVSNLEAFYIASRLLESQQTDALSVRDPLISLINQDGELKFLNAAHLSKATDGDIDRIASSIVSTFFEKTPANAGPEG